MLTRYVDDLERNLQNYQLQERFIESVNSTQGCNLAESYFNQTVADLDYYWTALPSRLEEYERANDLDERYLTLKQEYTTLSLRAWLIARDTAQQCDASVVPALYFYDTSCEKCVDQGRELDLVKRNIDSGDKTFIAFTIDSSSTEPVISLIKQHYNVTSTPAIIINEQVLQGRVFTAEQVEGVGVERT